MVTACKKKIFLFAFNLCFSFLINLLLYTMNIAWISNDLRMFLYHKLLWIKASDKCMNINVNWNRARNFNIKNITHIN